MSWPQVRIDNICDIFDGPHATPSKTGSGPVFLGISSLVGGRLDLSETEHLSEDDFEKWTRRVTPQAGDLVFSYETRLGEAALIPEGLRCCLGRRMGLLRAKPGKVDPKFLLYAYLGPQFQETLRARTFPGSTVDRIPLIEMGEFPIQIPPTLDEQRAIAHILGTLDDKIELNRRQNETLEAMARALFKSWFVDFDPVRAKAEGRDTGLPAHIADLFPDTFEDSERGEIPKGWGAVSLKELTLKIGSGATPRGGKDVYVKEGIAFVRSQNVYDSQFIWDGLAHITAEQGEELANVGLMRGDVLLNITGASILRTCIVDPGVLPARVNQHVAIIRPKPGIPNRFLHLHLLQKSTKNYLLGMNAGGSREAVTKGHIESVPILFPPQSVLTQFQIIEEGWFQKAENNMQETRSLIALRDCLLPKLLSGELRIKEAGRLVDRTDAGTAEMV